MQAALAQAMVAQATVAQATVAQATRGADAVEIETSMALQASSGGALARVSRLAPPEAV